MLLHPEALVVRGGTVRDVAALNEKVQDAIEDGDGAVISVFGDVERTDDNEGMGLAQLCAVSDIAHTKVQVTTAARLLVEGFEAVLDVSDGQPFTHHHVALEQPVQESTLGVFISCFDEPVPNPTGGRRRSK